MKGVPQKIILADVIPLKNYLLTKFNKIPSAVLVPGGLVKVFVYLPKPVD